MLIQTRVPDAPVMAALVANDREGFYAAEAAKVIQCYLHAAALAGYTLNDLLEWSANPRTATLPSVGGLR